MIAQPPSVVPVAAHPALHLALLGPPSVAWHGRPLAVDRRQSRALLYRVAAASDPVPRDQLCFLLWPDVPDSAARRNLSVMLTHVRRALPVPNVLLADPDGIALNPTVAGSDARVFATVAAAARQERGSAHLQGVIDQYRGAFLDGFSLPGCPEFDAWRDTERYAWERRYLDTLATLVDRERAIGNVEGAIAAAVRYLAVDPLAEEMQRRLMALYAGSGDRAAALTQFERCVIALERELGVDPLPETRAVYEAIRDGHTPALDQHAATHAAAPLQVSPASARLPAPATPLLGRADELAAARDLLHSGARLVTLCGPGGSGKTRLALAIAASLDAADTDGVVWVPLAPLRDPALVADAIVQAVGLQVATTIEPRDLLRGYVQDKQLVLVLDNYEHLLPAAALLAELLAAGPGLQLLVTSRARLNLHGEHALPVPPLPLPDLAQLPPPDALAAQPAVALLLARARQHQPALRLTPESAAELAAICVRLDGLPLALELAAARLRVVSPRELLRRLDRRLALLNSGARDLPERQQTLRATIAWSYQLLGEDERRLLDQLAVFAGGWTPDAVEVLSPTHPGGPRSMLNRLQELLDASLIERHDGADGEPRFGMLETIRDYARERLEASGELDALGRHHAAYFLALAEQAEPELTGPQHARWLDTLEAEHSNLRAAVQWALERDEPETALRLGGALQRFWLLRGHVREGWRWVETALMRGEGVAAGVRAKGLRVASRLACAQGDAERAAMWADQALALYRALDDQAGVAEALMCRGISLELQGDFAAATTLLEECLARYRALDDHGGVCRSVSNLAVILIVQGDAAKALPVLEEALALARAGANAPCITSNLINLGLVEVSGGRHAAAAPRFRESLARCQQLGDKIGLRWSLEGVAGVAAAEGQPERATRLWGAAAAVEDILGAPLPSTVRAQVDRMRAAARAQVDAAAWQAAWAEGQAMTLEQATAYALEGLPEPS